MNNIKIQPTKNEYLSVDSDNFMNNSMAKIKRLRNTVYSIKLRDGSYGLLQILEKDSQVAVFNCFNDCDNWDNILLNKASVLFMTNIIAKSIFSRSSISIHNEIKPVADLSFPKKWISLGHGNRMFKVWEGTKFEREIFIIGEGNNLLVTEGTDYNEKTYEPILLEDYDKYKELELDAIHIYPEFNERLLLCKKLNMNIDPLKELAFNRVLDYEFKTYIDIISGKVLLSDLGY